MPKRKVLIITYYWPPSGGVAVQRTLKFVKYLQTFGWQPVVFTVSNGGYEILDYLLEKQIPDNVEVIKKPIFEPYSIYNFFAGKRKKHFRVSTKPNSKNVVGLMQKIFYFIRGNLFIPDTRCFWIRPSVKFLSDYLKTNPVDAIFSTGPPHSTHLIALKLSRIIKIPWVADFRDPWTEIYYYKELRLLGFVDKRYHELEKRVLQSANLVIVTCQNLKVSFELRGARQIKIISNGFDEEDFKFDKFIPLDSEFTITYAGSLPPQGNPNSLWQAIARLKSSNHPAGKNTKIKLVGKIDDSAIKSILEFGLEDNLELIGLVPHHEAIELINSAQVLLITIPNSENSELWVPAKLYEYMATKRPIICVSPLDCPGAQIINDAKIGQVFDYVDTTGIEAHLKELYSKFISNELLPNSNTTNKYSRKYLTEQLANALDELML